MTNSRFVFIQRRKVAFGAHVFFWAITLSVVMGFAGQAYAGSGGLMTLPMAGVKIRSGLKLQIDTRWVDGTGYRPVRIRVSPIAPGPAPADRSIQISLRPRSWRMGTSRLAATQTVRLSQGAMYGEATLAIPHYEMWNSFEIETYEDGDLLNDLCARGLGTPVRSYYNWSEATPSIIVLDRDAPPNLITSSLRVMPSTGAGGGMQSIGVPIGMQSTGMAGERMISSNILALASPLPLNDWYAATGVPYPNELPDIRALASRIPLSYYGGIVTQELFKTTSGITDASILRLLIDVPRLDILPPSDLPDNWLALSCVDIIMVSFDELQHIARELPRTLQAMRQWQASGATLCVFGVGEEYERLAELESFLEAAPLPIDARLPYARGWMEPKGTDYTEEVHALMAIGTNAGYYNMTVQQAGQTSAVTNMRGDPPGIQRFLFREVQQGEVVAMQAANPFPGETSEWSWLFNSISEGNWMWYRRHGVSMHRENPDYWDLLIPGVGEAPVNSFLVLITLFVIVIGPVNYFVLQRQRRLYLILLTVPLGALMISVSLLLYALTTDGLGVRLRVRSITEIDQHSGQVVAWSRQSYYAGLSPSGGLLFPSDAAVYPVEHRPLGRTGRREGRNQLIWEDGQQRLASGFLTTRSTKQFLVVESRETQRGLSVDETTDPPQVTNVLGTTIEDLIVRTSSGQLFAVVGLAPDATADLVMISKKDATKKWRNILAANRPAYPVGFNPHQMENAADFFNTYNYSQEVDQLLPGPTFRSSIFERRVRDLTRFGLKGLSARSYLASVTKPVEVSVGIKDAREEAGFHLVMGRW